MGSLTIPSGLILLLGLAVLAILYALFLLRALRETRAALDKAQTLLAAERQGRITGERKLRRILQSNASHTEARYVPFTSSLVSTMCVCVLVYPSL